MLSNLVWYPIIADPASTPLNCCSSKIDIYGVPIKCVNIPIPEDIFVNTEFDAKIVPEDIFVNTELGIVLDVAEIVPEDIFVNTELGFKEPLDIVIY